MEPIYKIFSVLFERRSYVLMAVVNLLIISMYFFVGLLLFSHVFFTSNDYWISLLISICISFPFYLVSVFLTVYNRNGETLIDPQHIVFSSGISSILILSCGIFMFHILKFSGFTLFVFVCFLSFCSWFILEHRSWIKSKKAKHEKVEDEKK